jgi:dihydrofolate reductase
MKRKLILYTASSLDGFIAREDHALDWLFEVEQVGDTGYNDFYETVDTILIGRKTYEQILILENGGFPYKGKECYVFSRTKQAPTEHIEFVNDNVVDFTKSLKEKDGGHIWLVGGGDLLHTFLREGLVDEFIIQFAPVVISSGIPLFKFDDLEVKLSLKDVNRFGQFVQVHYEVK